MNNIVYHKSWNCDTFLGLVLVSSQTEIQCIFSVSVLQCDKNIPLHVSGVQRTDAVSQRFVGVSRDLLELVGLHLLKQTGQVLLPGLQLSPLVGGGFRSQ